MCGDHMGSVKEVRMNYLSPVNSWFGIVTLFGEEVKTKLFQSNDNTWWVGRELHFSKPVPVLFKAGV
jgi:hypothetical protein